MAAETKLSFKKAPGSLHHPVLRGLHLLPPSWAWSSSAEVPRYHRALTMASAWERKYLYSELGKRTVLLPNLLLSEDFIWDNLVPKVIVGVLFLADFAGGLGTVEPPQKRATGAHQALGSPGPWMAQLFCHC